MRQKVFFFFYKMESSFDFDFDLNELFKDDPEVTVTQLDNLPTQDLVVNKFENERFKNTDILTESQLKEFKAGRIPKNTKKQNCWAMSCYVEWAIWRNMQRETLLDKYSVVPLELGSETVDKIDYWLSKFIIECRRKDGKNYPPTTLYNMATAIQRCLREDNSRNDIHMFDENDPSFCEFRKALDSKMKMLTSAGLGIHRERADPITEDDENRLWEKQVIGFNSARSLSHGVFFYNCKIFGFRGGDEHRNLEVDQYEITFENDIKVLTFRGRNSKNVQGGLKQRKIEPKIIKQFQDENNPRCVVALFEKYLSCVPSSGQFYRKPLANACDGSIVFSNQCVGVNMLGKYMKTMFSEAGIETGGRNIRNHSGKVTLCTRMYERKYDEQAIMARSGHRSTAVRDYKRPPLAQLKAISDDLQPPTDVKSKQNANSLKEANNHTARDEIEIRVPESIKTVIINKAGKKVTITL